MTARTGGRCRGEIAGHDRRRPAQERKRVGLHPRISHRKQLRDPGLALLDQDFYRITTVCRRLPCRLSCNWHLVPPIDTDLTTFVEHPQGRSLSITAFL
jgi:hypothetical protein